MKRLAILFLLVGTTFSSSAQNTYAFLLTSAGGEFQTEQLMVSWSLGEPIIETLSSSSLTLTQGFQQPWLKPVSIPQINTSDHLTLQVFPNPAVDHIMVFNSTAEFSGSHEIIIRLYDFQGRMLFHCPLTENPKIISVAHLKSGVYYLRLHSPESGRYQTVVFEKINP